MAVVDFFIELPDGTLMRCYQDTVTLGVWETQSLVDPNDGSKTIGQKVMAGSLPVTLASDQTPIPFTTARSANATTTSKTASDVDQELLAANPARLSGSIYNNSTTATLLVRFNVAATGALFKVSLAPLAAPFFFTHTGSVHGIWTGTIAGLAQLSEEYV